MFKIVDNRMILELQNILTTKENNVIFILDRELSQRQYPQIIISAEDPCMFSLLKSSIKNGIDASLDIRPWNNTAFILKMYFLI